MRYTKPKAAPKKRLFPALRPGMTTEQYVKRYFELNPLFKATEYTVVSTTFTA